MNEKNENDKYNNYFFIQSSSDSSLFLLEVLKQKRWREWKLGTEEDIKVQTECKIFQGLQEADKNQKLNYRDKILNYVSFYWLRHRMNFPYDAHRELKYQQLQNKATKRVIIVNHTGAEPFLTSKSELARSIIENGANFAPFHPKTFLYSLSHNKKEDSPLLNFENLSQLILSNNHGNKKNIWILKPSGGSCGRGIQILDLSNLNKENENEIEEMKKRIKDIIKLFEQELSSEVIAQQYITNPLLFHNCKFDFRVYLFISSIQQPFFSMISKKGYIRICSEEYTENDYSIKTGHITNFHVQREHPLYDPDSDSILGKSTRASYDDLLLYLFNLGFTFDDNNNNNNNNNNGNDDTENGKDNDSEKNENWVKVKEEKRFRRMEKNMWKKINKIVKNAVLCLLPKIKSHPKNAAGQFSLLGIDLLFDRDQSIWLLEFTKSPAYRMTNSFLEDLHQPMLKEVVEIVMDIEEKRLNDPLFHVGNIDSLPSVVHSSSWSPLLLSD